MSPWLMLRAWAGVVLPPAVVLLAVAFAVGAAGTSVAAMVVVFVGIVVLLLLVFWAARCDTVVLDAVSAEQLRQAQAPALFDIVATVSKRLRRPVPGLTVSRTATPFALVAGRPGGRVTLCVSEGLLRELDERQVGAVVAHELAHTTSGVLIPRTVAAAWATGFLAISDSNPLLSVLNPVGLGIRRLGISPGQQSACDERAARLVVDPLAIAGALRALDAGTGRARLLPTGRLVAVSALMTVSPFGNDVRAARLADQPDTGARTLRLEALAGYRR